METALETSESCSHPVPYPYAATYGDVTAPGQLYSQVVLPDQPYGGATLPGQPLAVPAASAQEKADSFSRVSAALVALGLLLIGGAIGPLLVYFEVLPAAVYAIGAVYLATAALTVMWLVGRLFARSFRRDSIVRGARVAVLAAAEAALLILTVSCYEFAFRWEATAIVLALVLLAVHSAPGKAARRAAYGLLRANEIAVMFLVAGIMAQARMARFALGAALPFSTVSTVCYACALALLLAVVVLRVRELFSSFGEGGSSAGNAGFLVMTVFAVVALATAFVWGCTPLYRNAFAYDVVFMASALLCVVLGFAASRPALRHIGLVLVLCTVAKMVLLDTLSYDLLSKALAFAIGGAVCFGIGAAYNHATKRLVNAHNEEPVG